MKNTKTFTSTFREQPAAPSKRGRSSQLIQQRNQCLTDRYYYYGAFTDKRYEAVVALLSTEFFLTVPTLQDIINNHTNRINELKKEQPPLSYFQQRWPGMRWL